MSTGSCAAFLLAEAGAGESRGGRGSFPHREVTVGRWRAGVTGACNREAGIPAAVLRAPPNGASGLSPSVILTPPWLPMGLGGA